MTNILACWCLLRILVDFIEFLLVMEIYCLFIRILGVQNCLFMNAF